MNNILLKCIIALCLFVAHSVNINAAAFNWTGAVNEDWFNEANWNLSSVPGPSDEVFISNAGTIIIEGDAICKRISITTASNTYIRITPGSTLKIDVASENLDGLFLADGVFHNEGILTIAKIISPNNIAEAIDCRGKFINEGNIEIANHQFTQSVIGNTEAVFISSGDSLLNYGTIEFSENTGDCIVNNGVILNYGTMNFDDTNTGYGIFNDQNGFANFVINDGLMNFNMDRIGLFNFSGTVENNGSIFTGASSNPSGLASINNIGTFNNNLNGKIYLIG
ncbi:MAG: hypothetical protein AAGK97_03160, partial [Bacteroidota bacterium]